MSVWLGLLGFVFVVVGLVLFIGSGLLYFDGWFAGSTV